MPGASGDDGEDVAGAEDEQVLAPVLDLGSAVLAEDDLVADADVERDAVAVVVDPARAHGDDLALLRLLLGGVRDDETGRGGLLGFDRLDDKAILERLDGDRHWSTSPFKRMNVAGIPRGERHWKSSTRLVGVLTGRT